MWTISLLMVMAPIGTMFVPAVSADENLLTVDNQTIFELFEPINAEIGSKMAKTVTTDGLAKTDFELEKYSEELIQKYQGNLDLIIDSLEKETEQKLSNEEREDLKQIIVQEHIERASWDEFKKKLGVKDEDFRSLNPVQEDSLTQNEKSRLPTSLVLVQVSADLYGGTGLDGAGMFYSVNGDNDLISVSVDTNYPGKDLYECLFIDEDVPSPNDDIVYDAFRLAVYGTLNDLQGFFIYDSTSIYRDIEFGNDYDNGYAYGTLIGQHGARTYSGYTPGVPIYISNVWNHAMGLDDRNSNMAKTTYYYY